MKFLNFSNGSNISLIVKNGEHEFKQDLINQILNELTIEKGATFTINTMCWVKNVVNEGTLNVGAITLNGAIENHGIVNLNAGANVTGTLTNENITNVEGGVQGTPVKVFEIVNNNTCVNCGTDKAVLNVNNGATLDVVNLINQDTVENYGVIDVSDFENNGVLENNGIINIENGVNTHKIDVVNGKLNVLANFTNDGLIYVMNEAEVLATGKAVLKNTELGLIQVEGDLMDNIQNSGYIYVINYGHVIANGCVSGQSKGIIDVTNAKNDVLSNQAKDTNTNGSYFRYDVNNEATAKTLETSLKDRISELNYGVNKLIVRWTRDTKATKFSGVVNFGNVQRIVIEKDLVIDNDARFSNLADICYAIDCKQDVNKDRKAAEIVLGATVTVANGKTLTLNDDIKIWVDGKVKVNNWAKLAGNVDVRGDGRFEFDTPMSNITWTNGSFGGEWLGSVN